MRVRCKGRETVFGECKLLQKVSYNCVYILVVQGLYKDLDASDRKEGSLIKAYTEGSSPSSPVCHVPVGRSS